MAIATKHLEIAGNGTVMRAFAAWDDALSGRPGVLIAPSFFGLTLADEAKASEIAELGYVALAFDYFGKPASASSFAQAMAWSAELFADRREVQRRMAAAIARLRELDGVDPDHVAAIGYCLGGKCVLDLARSGHAFDGAVVLHGVFDPPPFPNADEIIPKVLVCHGWDDHLCLPEAAVALMAELTSAKADWQLHAYGHVNHGFTNDANPAMYSGAADRRSWQAVRNFFNEMWS